MKEGQIEKIWLLAEFDGQKVDVCVDAEIYMIERDVDCITYRVTFASFEDDVFVDDEALIVAERLMEKAGYRTTKEWSN